jgi:hypothetical protein
VSFIRPGEQDSDIYAYPAECADGREVFICCGPHLHTKQAVRAHFDQHRADGYCVPDEAYRRLDEWDRVAAEWDVVQRTGRWS